MSLQQYNSLMSNLLKEKYTLAKLREELKGRKGKLCRSCKGFRYLAHNCKNKKEREKGTIIPQNKFEILKSIVIQCRVEEKTIRKVAVVEVEYYKCGERRHKCRKCLLWERKKRVAHVAKLQKAHPVKGKAQERERRLRRTEKEEVVHVAKP